jgi:hypothetical protein
MLACLGSRSGEVMSLPSRRSVVLAGLMAADLLRSVIHDVRTRLGGLQLT